jgi:hypothetical protein
MVKKEETTKEEFKVSGDDILKKIKEIIEEGNARRIIIKNGDGDSIMEIPLTIGVVGALIAPYLAAIGAIAAVVSNCSIIVEKRK